MHTLAQNVHVLTVRILTDKVYYITLYIYNIASRRDTQ